MSLGYHRATELRKPDSGFLPRKRVFVLLREALKKPLTAVIGGTGYGKTRLVRDYLTQSGIAFVWVRCVPGDNDPRVFWGHLMEAWRDFLPGSPSEAGFPCEKEAFADFAREQAKINPVWVFDDAHVLNGAVIISFAEHLLEALSQGGSVVVIGRALPDLNLLEVRLSARLTVLDENDLSFTPSELSQILQGQGILAGAKTIADMVTDTAGWPLAVSYIISALMRSPGYAGFVQKAMRRYVFTIMQNEVWDSLSPKEARYLIRLSLVKRLSISLALILADDGAETPAVLSILNAYIRLDRDTDAYRFLPLFLDFLQCRQGVLSAAERESVWRSAARWNDANGFTEEAWFYYQKVGDYAAITEGLSDFPAQIPYDTALVLADIFSKAPQGALFSSVAFAARHLQVLMSLGRGEDAHSLAMRYEAELALSADTKFAQSALGILYCVWGKTHMLFPIAETAFDRVYAKMADCLAVLPVGESFCTTHFHVGPWAGMVYLNADTTETSGEDFYQSLKNAERQVKNALFGRMNGISDLCLGEAHFYRGELKLSEQRLLLAVRAAKEARVSEVKHRAEFYLMRIAASRGDYESAVSYLKSMESDLTQKKYVHSHINYEIAAGWHYIFLKDLEPVSWRIKQPFLPYAHTCFTENFENLLKARYCYAKRSFAPLLAYISEARQREITLYGSVDLLVLEACAYFQMKEKERALEVFREVLSAAAPHGIIMPFMEMGKDMRTLTAFALREGGDDTDRRRIESINRRASSYAKYQTMAASVYRGGKPAEPGLSVREKEVLRDLYNGLSRSEIAANHNISVNTVNSIVSYIYEKLNAANLVDVIRIVAERKLL